MMTIVIIKYENNDNTRASIFNVRNLYLREREREREREIKQNMHICIYLNTH